MNKTHENYDYDSVIVKIGFWSAFKEILSRRELIKLLVNRDLSVRYRKSILGIFWTMLNPLLTTTVMWFVFVALFGGRLPDNQQYAPFVLSGVLVLTFFNQGFSQAADSLSSSYPIISKIYVPPQVFAFSGSLSNAVNFVFGCFVLMVVSVATGEGVGILSPLSLIFIASMILYVTGLGLVVATIYVRFDDSRNIVVVLLQLMTYLTPIFYPKNILSEPVRFVVNLNPLTSYLEVFRATFCNTGVATLFDWIYMLLTALSIFIFGIKYFSNRWMSLVARMS
jgi:ABC-type polysaccharide/polyol phosphate export permease